MLEKLSAVVDTKLGQMKRELEEVTKKAHDSQMTELKRMKFSEQPSFKKKGHEVQYKHNERVKLCITEAEDAIKEKKINTSVLKILRQGYILPLTSLPKPVVLGNSKSALENESLVTEAYSLGRV